MRKYITFDYEGKKYLLNSEKICGMTVEKNPDDPNQQILTIYVQGMNELVFIDFPDGLAEIMESFE